MYSLKFKSELGKEYRFDDIPLSDGSFTQDDATVTLKNNGRYTDISIEIKGSRACEVTHSLSTALRNFHSVIVPDSGREYINLMQTIGIWCKDFKSAINDVKTPLYIFNGQDGCASLCFGIIGQDYERNFRSTEPHRTRALSLFARILAFDIVGHIPESYRADVFTESVYMLDEKEDTGIPFFNILREFHEIRQQKESLVFPYNEKSMYPIWCSWTDWDSRYVTEDVVVENVKAGMELGIENYIIDDGWFGPGLDCDFEETLTLGDWETDTTKFSDIKLLSDKIHALGARGIIWCAPHAVADGAKCRPQRLKHIMKDKDGNPIYTFNNYNPLCPRCAEARQIMVDNCVHLLRDYDTDGAKYDLFNNFPLVECESTEHEHDCDSMMEGLEKALKQIWEAVTALKPDYIVELKQNYGGSKLSQYGTMVRAGDTPYCPDGNFLRTAYIQAYNKYALNDYQSITDNDSLLASARIIIKMLSVGSPTYSMNLVTLSDEVKKLLKFLNFWYIDNIVKANRYKRDALDANLTIWKIDGEKDNIYFTVNSARLVDVDAKDFQLLNGSAQSSVLLKTNEPAEFELELYNVLGELISTVKADLSVGYEIDKNSILIKARKL